MTKENPVVHSRLPPAETPFWLHQAQSVLAAVPAPENIDGLISLILSRWNKQTHTRGCVYLLYVSIVPKACETLGLILTKDVE
jgi:hypothetical protein